MELSILIPARNEMFLSRTVEDIINNCEAETEVIVVLDGGWANPPIKQHPMVNVIYLPESIGQRKATNKACELARGKYVAKVDAHCSFDKGFDRKMIDAFEKVGDNVVMVPVMKNLWAFDWKCYTCGSRWYQGPTPNKCMKQKGGGIVENDKCNETSNFKRKITWRVNAKKGESAYENWRGENSPKSTSFCFDSEPHFQYFNEHKKTEEYREQIESGITETMSLQGSFFMCTREKYWEYNICDEDFGSWGSQGIEVACKFWLSGGRVLVNHNTWYAHMFRTQGGDFGFPYENPKSKTDEAKKRAKDIFFNNKWEKQKYPISWLVEKFWPVKGWTQEELQKLKEGKL